jgi:hypothetical protein
VAEKSRGTPLEVGRQAGSYASAKPVRSRPCQWSESSSQQRTGNLTLTCACTLLAFISFSALTVEAGEILSSSKLMSF